MRRAGAGIGTTPASFGGRAVERQLRRFDATAAKSRHNVAFEDDSFVVESNLVITGGRLDHNGAPWVPTAAEIWNIKDNS